jgi:hypothetical protein
LALNWRFAVNGIQKASSSARSKVGFAVMAWWSGEGWL